MATSLATTDDLADKETSARRVLVVDDDPQLRELLSEALQSAGMRVRLAPDGETALSLYHEHQASRRGFDLVLLDLSLPAMTGRECLSRLLDLDSEAQVLITTGRPPEDGEELVGPGPGSAAGFLQKPFSLHYLLGRVHRLLERPGQS
jgi:two-component system OmpR family response regulator